ncbi:MAG: 1-phosphofructokinase family hexose kinase [Chitinophagaceae bacterium]|nr:1-phosphofructokinase family hexose kinase [Chitinophagaceae bacterium]
MILTITLNPCIDKSSKVDKLKPESKLRCTEVVNEPGGGGINVSKALKKLDTPSVALFPAGGHNGNMLCSLLKEEGVLFHAVDTKTETRENWVVLETSANNQYRFTFPGREVQEETVKLLVEQIRSFAPAYVVASGSLPPGLPDYFYGLIVKNAAAVGARCIVDTSGPALQALKGKNAYLIKPNIGELCKMLNVEWLDKNEVPDAAQQAIRDGFSEIIVISMGPDGAWLVTENDKYFVQAPAVEKKSTVGAGDSMVAGITYSLQKGMTLRDALRFGVACGSAATMNEGTKLFEKEDAEKLYKIICEQ